MSNRRNPLFIGSAGFTLVETIIGIGAAAVLFSAGAGLLSPLMHSSIRAHTQLRSITGLQRMADLLAKEAMMIEWPFWEHAQLSSVHSADGTELSIYGYHGDPAQRLTLHATKSGIALHTPSISYTVSHLRNPAAAFLFESDDRVYGIEIRADYLQETIRFAAPFAAAPFAAPGSGGSQ